MFLDIKIKKKENKRIKLNYDVDGLLNFWILLFDVECIFFFSVFYIYIIFILLKYFQEKLIGRGFFELNMFFYVYLLSKFRDLVFIELY